MSSSKSSPKHGDSSSFKPVSPFELFYQLTYMSAMAAAGLSRSKTFEIAALSHSPAAVYFVAINTLVDELRYDYPEACRRIGIKSKSDNMKSFLLRLSDALRSGEPLAEFLAREAEVQGVDYQNKYERDLEGLKQWTNAFSSIVISVALIVIIQMVSALIYSMNSGMMTGLIGTGFAMSAFGAYIIRRTAPREIMTVPAAQGSMEQRRALRLGRLLGPLALIGAMLLSMLHVDLGWILIGAAALLFPIGFTSMRSDQITVKKDIEFSTFMRSVGGMATSSGTTLKQALTVIDLSSFPALEPDIRRLSTRLQALVDPEICWQKFGIESGSKLIQESSGIFYSAVKAGGDPERVGYLCSLFTARTAQLRAKRRLTAGTFSGLATVMQAIVAGIMVFVLSIVRDFTMLVASLTPTDPAALQGQSSGLSLISVTAADVEFLAMITVVMILLLALVGAAAIIFCDGGYKLKAALYLGLTLLISGISFLVVPGVVAGILKV